MAGRVAGRDIAQPGANAGTVLVTPRSFGQGSAAVERELERAGVRVARGSAAHDPAELAPVLSEATGWIAGTAPITDAHLRAAPRLRVIARYGVGVDNVDRHAVARRGIVLTNTPDANAEAVADHTLALLLAVLRRVPAGDRDVRAGAWTARRGRELGALTLGLLGFGRIGRAVARRARGFGSRVLACDPHVDAGTLRAHGARASDLGGLVADCDVVSLHLPGGGCVVDGAWLSGTSGGVTLVNTARADLVDEDAVAAALREGRLDGYAADTLRDPDPDVSPLLAADLADRVIVTPHVGAQTVEAVDRMGQGAVRDVLDVLAGRCPAGLVVPTNGG